MGQFTVGLNYDLPPTGCAHVEQHLPVLVSVSSMESQGRHGH